MGIRLLGQSSVGSVLIVWATCACHVDGVENTSRQNNYADNLRTQPFAPVEIPGQNLEQILFRHGDGGLWCVRSPSITAAGHRLLAFAELWNYTGNYCFPKYGPLPISDDNAGFQVFGVRTSDDGGKSWQRMRELNIPFVGWNLQIVHFGGNTTGNGSVIIHIKDKKTGSLYQVISTDLGDTWGDPVNISKYFPPELSSINGLRPAYGHGIIVPSAANPQGRILMTGYDRFFPNTSCFVYASVDGGATWALTSQLNPAFECQVASIGDHDVYVNARHARISVPPHASVPARPVARVQATSAHDGAAFVLNYSYGWLFSPDPSGVYGATVSRTKGMPRDGLHLAGRRGGQKRGPSSVNITHGGLTAEEQSSDGGSDVELYFAIASGPALHPTQPASEQNSARRNLVVHRLASDGQTWEARLVHAGYAGYVDMVVMPHSADLLGIFWETADNNDPNCTGTCALAFMVVNTTALFP